MEKNVEDGVSGFLNYSYHGNKRSLYYKSMEFNGWSMVTIGAMDKYIPILNNLEKINFTFSILFAISALGIFITTGNIIRCRGYKMNHMKNDLLTNVYRRYTGEEIIKANFEKEHGHPYYGCIFIDIDDFKFINDTYGHDKGDAILRYLGDILKTSSRSQDVLYRYGGDEFCIWLSGNGGKEEIKKIGHRILSKTNEANMKIHLSIGATVIEKKESDWKAIIKRADEAVYHAKKAGKNQISFYEDKMD